MKPPEFSPDKLIAALSEPQHVISFPAAQRFISALVHAFHGQPWSRRDRRAFARSVRNVPRRVRHDGRVTR